MDDSVQVTVPEPPVVKPSGFKKFLPLIGLVLVLPAIVASVQVRKLVDSRAALYPTAEVRIDPGKIDMPVLPSGTTFLLSALLYDQSGKAGLPISDGVDYVWHMSSVGGIGNLVPDSANSKLAKFVSSGVAGQGDIFVQATYQKNTITGSIPVKFDPNTVIIPTPTPFFTPTPGVTSFPVPSPTSPPTPMITPTPSPTRTPTPSPKVTPIVNPTSTPFTTPTPFTTSVPFATPTPTPQVATNAIPRITTVFLIPPVGALGSLYTTTITGEDTNPTDVLVMKATSVPLGVTVSGCVRSTTSTVSRIVCTLRLIPRTGSYRINVELLDGRGGKATKNFLLPIWTLFMPQPVGTF